VKRALALVGTTVALAASAAGCGGGGGSTTTTTTGTEPAVEWAGDFCSAVVSWRDQLTTIGKSLVSSPSKEGLQKAADDVKAANQKLADDLRGLGTPDTESGQKVKDSVDTLSTTVDTQLTKIEDAAKNVSGITGLVTAGKTIADSLAAMQTALTDTQTAIEDADVKGTMKTAFEQATSCQDLKGSSS
jgi:hypothetical protein